MDTQENNPKEKERLEKLFQLLRVKDTDQLCKLLENWSLEDCDAILDDRNLYFTLVDKALEENGDKLFIRTAALISARITAKECQESMPAKWSTEEWDRQYDEFLKSEASKIHVGDIVGLREDFNSYPAGYEGRVKDVYVPSEYVHERHCHEISFPIRDKETETLLWVDTVSVPVNLLELVRKGKEPRAELLAARLKIEERMRASMREMEERYLEKSRTKKGERENSLATEIEERRKEKEKEKASLENRGAYDSRFNEHSPPPGKLVRSSDLTQSGEELWKVEFQDFLSPKAWNGE